MRPVIVGLDVGGNGPEPLSPAYPSGRRLAELAGMTPDQFRRSFDRVNLFVGDAPREVAVENLLPILRGRRVVALGLEVRSALGIAGTGVWSVTGGGFVGAHLPHPSGLNRWWNDPQNVAAAQSFMSDLSRPCIHVEGPDGAGKSTLVDQLAEDLGLDVMPTSDPPRDWVECLDRIRDRLRPGIVSDRSSGLISELVYGPVLRGGTRVPEADVWRIVESVIHAVTFVYCRPRTASLRPIARPGEDPIHVAAVLARESDLVARYDQVMARVSSMGGRVVRYDRDVQGYEEVSACAA